MDTRNRDGQPARQALIWSAFLAAALLLATGLIFLLAAISQPQRLLVSLLLLACGVALAAWAGKQWRRLRRLSPQFLDGRIAELAAAQDAEVTLVQVISALDVPEAPARNSLQRLEANGLCYQETREASTVYVFPGLRERKVVRRCAYCGSQHSVRQPLHKCPNCGGDLVVVKQ